MNNLKVGVFADSMRVPIREGLKIAREMGVEYFQMFTTNFEFAFNDDFAPEKFDGNARTEFRKYYESLGMTLSATCADFGNGFTNAEKNIEMIPKTFKQLDLAVDLGANIVTTHIGVVPETPNEVWDILQGALNQIGSYAENIGVRIAIETGPESGPVLRSLLDSLNNKSICVNLDPANLVMAGYDLEEAVAELMPYIIHTHAKDGIDENKARAIGVWGEMPLGKGDVPWESYIKWLKEGGYDGVFTIEREVGDDPLADIGEAVKFLRML
jgi:L-ribulose-5-phosphate 3-epimerase